MEITTVLKDFMLTPAPAGYEKEMAYKLKAALTPFCATVELDRCGNCIGLIKGRNPALPTAMVFGHMDSVGFIVRKVDDDGYIQIDRLGGIPEKVLPATRMLVRNEDGEWFDGVIGNKAHHAASPEEKYKAEPITSLLVDIGAESAAQVHEHGIHVGCPIVYKPAYQELLGGKIAGTFVDNRGACACLVHMAEELCHNKPAGDVYVVGTVWEEFNLRGAMMAARSVHPDLAISLDVTLAGDTRDLANRYEDAVGAGPCVSLYSFHGRGTLNGTLPHEPLFKLIKRAAVRTGIELQRFASSGILTDAAYIQLEGAGVATLEMGFAARYTHTPVEVCAPLDIVDLSKVVCEAMRTTDDMSFQLCRF